MSETSLAKPHIPELSILLSRSAEFSGLVPLLSRLEDIELPSVEIIVAAEGIRSQEEAEALRRLKKKHRVEWTLGEKDSNYAVLRNMAVCASRGRFLSFVSLKADVEASIFQEHLEFLSAAETEKRIAFSPVEERKSVSEYRIDALLSSPLIDSSLQSWQESVANSRSVQTPLLFSFSRELFVSGEAWFAEGIIDSTLLEIEWWYRLWRMGTQCKKYSPLVCCGNGNEAVSRERARSLSVLSAMRPELAVTASQEEDELPKSDTSYLSFEKIPYSYRYALAEAANEVFDASISSNAFNPSLRKEGISGFMRLRNEAAMLPLVIESHLPHLDELVIVYNRCTDDTPEIVRSYAAQFPGKIKAYEYPFHVYPNGSSKHIELSPISPESLVHYYNFALSKTTHRYCVKVDGDHVAIPQAFSEVTTYIRTQQPFAYIGIAGVNLWDTDDALFVTKQNPLCGVGGDMGFFPVHQNLRFLHHERYEVLSHGLPRIDAGVAFFHLKHMKADRGLGNYDLEENPHSPYRGALRYLEGDTPELLLYADFCKQNPKLSELPSPESLGVTPGRFRK